VALDQFSDEPWPAEGRRLGEIIERLVGPSRGLACCIGPARRQALHPISGQFSTSASLMILPRVTNPTAKPSPIVSSFLMRGIPVTSLPKRGLATHSRH